MEKRKSESTAFPLQLERTETTVYVRSNIVPEERNSNGTKVTMYVYDEEQYTPAEYETKTVAQTRADVLYL